jgi:beta-galactosidase
VADGQDLAFVTVRLCDKDGLTVPESGRMVRFEVSGPGEIVATVNGDPTDLPSFSSRERAVFGGMALVIVRAKKNMPGIIKVRVVSDGLVPAEIRVTGR